MVAAAPAAMAAVEPDQAALDALVRARLAEEAGNPAEALAALQSLASQAPDLPGLRAEMLERAIDAGDLIAARNAAAALWASGDQRFDARLVLVVDAMRRSDWKGARAYLGTAQDDKSGGDAISRLIDPALGAWVDAGQRARQPERALVAAATRGRPEPAYALEAALVQLAAGQSDAAVAAALETTPTDRLSQLVALRLVASLDAARQKDAAGTLRSRIALAAGEREDPLLLLPEQAVTNPRAGAGHWLALVADTLARLPKSNARLPLTFARAATWLNDQDWTARSALADALARSDRAADGAAFLGGLRGPLPPVLRMRLAELTAEEGDRAAAVKIAEEAVTGDTPRSLLVRFADLARQSDDAAAAERAYTRLEAALGDGDDSAPLRATLLVARAELRLQAKDWDGAAPLMQRALALRPNDPTILNFVGYSALERRIDVDRALGQIEAAWKAEPQNASITDSLGWAYFLTGRTDRAVELLEQAQQGEPENAVIVEHLGDAYWKAGQRFRARYTWRAAALLAEEDMAARVAAKLEGGLTPQTTAP